MTRIVVDPVTRIEGHLRIEVESTGGTVTDAFSTGTMFRGIEKVLVGRDPLEAWVFTQRACGVCTHVHALASVRAVESALGVKIPPQARRLRNILSVTQQIHDHVVHFYHLHLLDWIDVTVALKADPAATAALAAKTNVGWSKNSAAYFTEVRNRLTAYVESGQLGPFASGYWGHPAYTMPAEANLLLLAHYLEALDFQREIVKIHAHIGGKNPHPQTYAVGGLSTTLGPSAPGGVNNTSLSAMKAIAASVKAFVDQVWLPDVVLLAQAYRTPYGSTVGRGLTNLLAYGDLPLDDTGKTSSLLQPPGRIIGGNLERVEPVDQAQVAETVAHSWYTYTGGDGSLLHPWNGQTQPAYSGPAMPYETITTPKYSWLKAPRYGGKPYEVGPLARTLIGYASGLSMYRGPVDKFVSDAGLSLPAMLSTIGRLAARALETQILAGRLGPMLTEVETAMRRGDVTVANPLPAKTAWPATARGWGTVEAPRGALGHWVVINNGKIQNYQMVVPTTWNGSPRDGAGARGAWEEALVGSPLADPTRPLELLRTVHSFDPCMGCSVHVLDPAGGAPLSVVEVV
jgi:hydrogenase large subunit